MTMENDDEKTDEIEMLREIRFVIGSTYKGTWNAIDKTDIGRYVSHLIDSNGDRKCMGKEKLPERLGQSRPVIRSGCANIGNWERRILQRYRMSREMTKRKIGGKGGK